MAVEWLKANLPTQHAPSYFVRLSWSETKTPKKGEKKEKEKEIYGHFNDEIITLRLTRNL